MSKWESVSLSICISDFTCILDDRTPERAYGQNITYIWFYSPLHLAWEPPEMCNFWLLSNLKLTSIKWAGVFIKRKRVCDVIKQMIAQQEIVLSSWKKRTSSPRYWYTSIGLLLCSSIVCFWMPPARRKECKYHIFGQYWYTKCFSIHSGMRKGGTWPPPLLLVIWRNESLGEIGRCLGRKNVGEIWGKKL